MNSGQKLLKKAKKIIPGGNQLLSKRSEMFLPDLWPAYYKKAKGCKIWDLDDKAYYDFAGMGVTSSILGYADITVNNALIKGIKKASMTTLNATEEIDLAKKLIKIHKWSDMAKFCKSGGEACLVAIRLARSFAKNQNIAFCGYHGWHDWYLAANFQSPKNLDKQLLTGLKTKGVSKSFSNSIKPFFYNDIKSLEKLFKKKKHGIGIIIMEPMRAILPKNNFLKKVKFLAKKNKAVLIFDEITSGFKDNYGGIHLKFKVDPDIAIFGKSIGNGFPISAIIGKKKIMDMSHDTFISSTMWTDRLGFIAAKTTLEKIKRLNVNKKISKYGIKIKKGWAKLAKKNNLKIIISGIDSIPNFKFDHPDNLKISTFFVQEMLKFGYLANNTLATTYAYNERIIDNYLMKVDKVFNKIRIKLKTKSLKLDGKIKHSTFRRITG